ncbi:MAG: hypothetical protein KGL44_09100 [Sphingomonadales bacterium]|nr:hypothetical protein [Sphingomonadales bacterium]
MIMATLPIDAVPTAAVIRPDRFPPAASARIAANLLNRHSPHEIAEAIEVLLDLLDLMGGDPEAEPATWPEDIRAIDFECLPDDSEAVGDEQDMSWPNRIRQDRVGPNVGTEDDEDDDPDTGIEDGKFDAEEDCCDAGDDGCGPIVRHGCVHWGSLDDAGKELPRPRYEVDQSAGVLPPTYN